MAWTKKQMELTRETVLSRMKALAGSHDPEVAHAEADDLLCDVLTAMDWTEVVDAYTEVPKWFG